MPKWIAITTDDLNDTKVAALVTQLRTAALAAGQDDPVEEVTANVVARIRAEISACQKNVLDNDSTTIPRDLKSLAARMIIRELMSRLQLELSEDERREASQDLRYLERIAECKVPVALPDTAGAPETQTGSKAEIVSKSTKVATREKMKGL